MAKNKRYGDLANLLASSVIALWVIDVPISDPGKPHVVLIVLDTVRADHLSAYGYSRATMPALDRWSQQNALLVRRAVSPAGWTAPAHASIFSGKTVSQHGIHDGPGSAFQTPAFDGIAWLPEIMAKRGYRSYAVTANPFAVPSDVTGFTRVFSPERAVWGQTIGAFVDRGKESVVIITSDHGEELGAEGRVGHEYGLSQTLVHVPLIIRSPGLEAGELDEVVDLRHLSRFVEMLSRGETT